MSASNRSNPDRLVLPGNLREPGAIGRLSLISLIENPSRDFPPSLPPPSPSRGDRATIIAAETSPLRSPNTEIRRMGRQVVKYRSRVCLGTSLRLLYESSHGYVQPVHSHRYLYSYSRQQEKGDHDLRAYSQKFPCSDR